MPRWWRPAKFPMKPLLVWAGRGIGGSHRSQAIGIVDIERRLGGLEAFRQSRCARSARAAGDLLQPITAGLADLFERIAALVKPGSTQVRCCGAARHHADE